MIIIIIFKKIKQFDHKQFLYCMHKKYLFTKIKKLIRKINVYNIHKTKQKVTDTNITQINCATKGQQTLDFKHCQIF